MYQRPGSPSTRAGENFPSGSKGAESGNSAAVELQGMFSLRLDVKLMQVGRLLSTCSQKEEAVHPVLFLYKLSVLTCYFSSGRNDSLLVQYLQASVTQSDILTISACYSKVASKALATVFSIL